MPPFIHLSIYSFLHPSVHSSIYLSIYSSIQSTVYTFIHQSIHSSIYLSIYSSIHLFILLFFLQSQEASLEHNTDVYKARLAAFGFNALVIDGHSIEAILAALKNAKETKDKPTALILKTFKGNVLNYINV